MTNQEIFEEACQYIPGGVNSPVRAFKSVGEIPVFAKKGDKAHLLDRKSTRLNSSHSRASRMPSSA